MGGLDQLIDRAFAPVSDAVTAIVFYAVPVAGADVPIIVVWLVAGAIFFTLYLRFINLRGFGHAIALTAGKYRDRTDPGEVSAFQALTAAVSGTVGVGNIAGVAITLSLGGPGAAFWLMVAGLLGMATKFVECTLGVMHRQDLPDGRVSGGPMYYLTHGLAAQGWPRLGRALGLFFAAAIVFGCLGIGNMFQANQAFVQLVQVTGAEHSWFTGKGWLVGLLLGGLVALIIIGGIKRIARVTDKLVPFMVVVYVGLALVVLVIQAPQLPAALQMIWQGAFSTEGIAGGVIGTMILGFQRAAFSNEAGLGSASIAHSAVRTAHPVTEGYVALLEPFIDTVIICMLTALVLTTTVYAPGFEDQGLAGIELTSAGFESVLPWSPVVLSVAAMLFAFSTMLAWSYYGLKGWTFLFGEGRKRELTFKAIFCLFVVLGCMVTLQSLLSLADALIFLMAFPNILGLYMLAPTVKRAMADYQRHLRGLVSGGQTG